MCLCRVVNIFWGACGFQLLPVPSDSPLQPVIRACSLFVVWEEKAVSTGASTQGPWGKDCTAGWRKVAGGGDSTSSPTLPTLAVDNTACGFFITSCLQAQPDSSMTQTFALGGALYILVTFSSGDL